MIRIGCFDIAQAEGDAFRLLYERASVQRQQRSDRYLRQEDKLRCVVGDGLIRYAVRRTLSLQTFTVATDPMGKPYLEGAEGFHFNLSHSGRWVVIGYGSSPLGIDVQQIRPDTDRQAIARRFFTPEEQAYLREHSALDDFFQLWTAKESYLKYLGVGLRQPLDSFSVLPDQCPRDVNFHTLTLEDHCLTLCAAEAPAEVEYLSLAQLLEP